MSRAAPQPRAPRPPRVLYLAGPGDILGTYRHWKEGRDDPGQVALTYSGQFYDVCRELGAEGYAVSYHPRKEFVTDGPFKIEHRPAPHQSKGAFGYLLGQWTSALGYVATAKKFGADVVVACDGQCGWVPLRLLRLFGIRLVPTIHCVLWRHNKPPRGLKGLLRKLDAGVFRRTASAVLCVSSDIAKQVSQLTGGRSKPLIEFVPNYQRESFEGIDPPPAERSPFRVLYAGRVEQDKGVFDLLSIAERFAREGRPGIEFDLCGDGSALEELKRRTEAAGLPAHFRLHGHCTRPIMRRMYGQSHVVIVPTTSQFIEGFNKVVAEGVLAGRPVITSSVCPALDYVRGAVVEVPPDDVQAYGDAILKLADDAAFYDERRSACSAAAGQFYDRARGWAAALKRGLGRAGLRVPGQGT